MNRRAVLIGCGLLAIIFCVTGSRAVQSPQQAAAGADSAIEDFWKRWEGGSPSIAIRNAWPAQRQWDAVGREADEFQNRTGGKCLGHSPVARRSLGPNVEFACFFALYDPTPMRVEMLYYRATDKWNLISLRIDGNPARWLREASVLQLGDAPDRAEAADNGQERAE